MTTRYLQLSRMHDWRQVRLWIATLGYLETGNGSATGKKRATRSSLSSMKHLPDLDVILLVDSDDSRNVTVNQDLNSQMSQPLSYPCECTLHKKLLMAFMDMLPPFTCMSLQTSFSLSVPSVAQNEHVSSFRKILVTVSILVDLPKKIYPTRH